MGLSSVAGELLIDGTSLKGCCCSPCPLDNGTAIGDLITCDVIVTIPGDSIVDDCSSGDCVSLAGSYTLPYLSAFTWRDEFTITTCGVSRTIRVTYQATSVGAKIIVLDVPSTTNVGLYYYTTLESACIFSPGDRDGIAAVCYTTDGTGSNATVEFVCP